MDIIVNSKTTDVELFNEMDLKEIGEYGVNIQSSIDVNCTNILNNVKVADLGDTGEKLDELQLIANKQSKALNSPFKFLKLSKITDKYVKAQDRIDNITGAISVQKNKLDEIIDSMMEQVNNLNKATSELKECENSLNEYIDYLKEKEDPDQTRLQAVSNRLKLITSSRVNAEQANIQALMIIKSNQESQYQLNEVIQNVVPILKMQAINSIGIQANKDAIDIANRTKKITGELILKNANDIKDLATELENNRNSSPIDDAKLKEAQNILRSAIDIVSQASALEAENNIRISKELAESAQMNTEYIQKLSKNNKKGLPKKTM